MGRLRLVSIADFARGPDQDDERLNLIDGLDVTILAPNEAFRAAPQNVRRVAAPTRVRGQTARFASVGAALSLLDPDIVHLQADPGSALARNVAGWCRRHARRGLVLDCTRTPERRRGLLRQTAARMTLSTAHAVLVQSQQERAEIRRLGFEGYATLAGRGQAAAAVSRETARQEWHLGSEATLVLGCYGALQANSGITDVLDAMAICDGVTLVVASDQPGANRVRHLADALDLLSSLRCVTTEAQRAGVAGLDAVFVADPRTAKDRLAARDTIALAQTHAVPVIHSGRADLAELVGAGGWAVPSGDAAMLARLLGELIATPGLLRDAGGRAMAHAGRRHSFEAAAEDLAGAIRAADAARQSARNIRTPPGHRLLAALRRIPSRT